MSQAASDGARSKRARIVRRTLVGAGIASAVVALMLAANASPSGRIVLAVGIGLALGACLELVRMGPFAGRHMAWVLWPCLLVAAALGFQSVLDFESRDHAGGYHYHVFHGDTVATRPSELACIALLAATSRASLEAWSGGRWARAAVALAWSWIAAWFCNDFVFPERWRFHGVGVDWTLGSFALLALAPAALVALTAQFQAARASLSATAVACWLAPLATLSLPWLWHVWKGFGQSGLVCLIVLSKVGDVAGYYVGSAIGVRRPFPRVSPNKTVAGCVGSLVAATVVGSGLAGLGWLATGAHVLTGAAVGAVTNLASQAGDLLESWIKRRAGVKDSGSWFGPSGGVLDLVDSLLLSVPVALLAWPPLLE